MKTTSGYLMEVWDKLVESCDMLIRSMLVHWMARAKLPVINYTYKHLPGQSYCMHLEDDMSVDNRWKESCLKKVDTYQHC